MATISKRGMLPIWRHYQGSQLATVMRYTKGKLTSSRVGDSFLFKPLNTQVAEVPIDDQELPFQFVGRSSDFQDVTVQGTITYRLGDPALISERVNFTVDLKSGNYEEDPIEKLDGLITQLAQQFSWNYLAAHPVEELLTEGMTELRGQISGLLIDDPAVTALGLQIVSVRVGGLRPKAEVEKLMQTPVFERLQQTSDEATFGRRAAATIQERQIAEAEQNNAIALEQQRADLIARQSENQQTSTQAAIAVQRLQQESTADNARILAQAQADARRIESEAEAQAHRVKADASAHAITVEEDAKVTAERDRMAIYAEIDTGKLFALAFDKTFGNLRSIGTLSLNGDLMTQIQQLLGQAAANGNGQPAAEPVNQ